MNATTDKPFEVISGQQERLRAEARWCLFKGICFHDQEALVRMRQIEERLAHRATLAVLDGEGRNGDSER